MSEAIQLLPLYSMALQKNLAFRGGADVRTDERANVQSQLANMPVDHSRCFTYPRMFRCSCALLSERCYTFLCLVESWAVLCFFLVAQVCDRIGRRRPSFRKLVCCALRTF